MIIKSINRRQATHWFASLLLGSMLVGCNQANSEIATPVITPVKLWQVPELNASAQDSFIAKIDATDRASLSFQVAGEIESLNVKMGANVSKGEVLALLEPNDYQLTLDAKRAEFELAKTGFERAKQLYKKKLISTDTYDQSETQYKAAQASLKQAQADLKYTKIIAPFDGVISMTFAKEHQVVAASQPVLNIINNQELDVVFTVPVSYVEENGLENIEFSPLTVTMDSRPELHVHAVFKEISTQPDPDTNSYTATVTMERPQTMNLLPGMAAQVHASHSRQSTGLSIADSAWLARTDQTGELFLFDQVTETISRVDVQFDSNGKLVSGLSAGDLIIEAGVDRLVEGQRVKAWTKEGGI